MFHILAKCLLTFRLVFKYCVLIYAQLSLALANNIVSFLIQMLSHGFFEKWSFHWDIFLQTFIRPHLVGPTQQQVHSSRPLFPQFRCAANLLSGTSLNSNKCSALFYWILVVELISLSEKLLITLFDLKVHDVVNTLTIVLRSLPLLPLFFLHVCLSILSCFICFALFFEGLKSDESIKKCSIGNNGIIGPVSLLFKPTPRTTSYELIKWARKLYKGNWSEVGLGLS